MKTYLSKLCKHITAGFLSKMFSLLICTQQTIHHKQPYLLPNKKTQIILFPLRINQLKTTRPEKSTKLAAYGPHRDIFVSPVYIKS